MENEPQVGEQTGNWRVHERRVNGGWTMAKEIVGTILGVLAVAVPICLFLLSWAGGVERIQSVHSTSIQYLHDESIRQEARTNSALGNIDKRLDKIDSNVQHLIERK